MVPGDRGPRSELIACAWLIDEGLEVFRSVSPSSSCDVVALNCETGEMLKYDVKTCRSSVPSLNQFQRRTGVRPLYVTHSRKLVTPDRETVLRAIGLFGPLDDCVSNDTPDTQGHCSQ